MKEPQRVDYSKQIDLSPEYINDVEGDVTSNAWKKDLRSTDGDFTAHETLAVRNDTDLDKTEIDSACSFEGEYFPRNHIPVIPLCCW